LAHFKEVFSVAFSPNEKGDFVSGGRNGYVNFFSRARPEPATVRADHNRAPEDAPSKAAVFHVQYSPTGQAVLAAARDGRITRWDVNGPTLLQTYQGHEGYVITAAWSKDGKWLASGGQDRKVRLWDVDSPTAVDAFEGHESDVESVAFHPNGKWLVSAAEDGQLRVWDLSARKLLFTVVVFQDDEHIAYLPNGHYTGTDKAYHHIRIASAGGAERELNAQDRQALFLSPSSFISLISGN
jgi:WD40 repeat protein